MVIKIKWKSLGVVSVSLSFIMNIMNFHNYILSFLYNSDGSVNPYRHLKQQLVNFYCKESLLVV